MIVVRLGNGNTPTVLLYALGIIAALVLGSLLALSSLTMFHLGGREQAVPAAAAGISGLRKQVRLLEGKVRRLAAAESSRAMVTTGVATGTSAARANRSPAFRMARPTVLTPLRTSTGSRA